MSISYAVFCLKKKKDQKKEEEFDKKALTGDGLSLEDFSEQLRHVKKLGSLQIVIKMLPSIGPFANMQKAADHVDDSQLSRVEAIINSMTHHERLHHQVTTLFPYTTLFRSISW